MKLVNPSLELKAIYSICNSNKVKDYLVASLSDTHFYHSPANAAFNRIKTILQERGDIMSWDELCNDPSLEEKYRKILKNVDTKKVKTEEKAKNLISKLNNFRQLRELTFMAENILNSVKGEKVNINEILDDAADSIASARTTAMSEDCFIHIGENTNANDRIKDILRGKTFNYIPTGFEVFDKVNRGLPVGALVTIAGTSGGGKSALSEQLVINMARWGAKCCYVPLEMDGDEMLQRMLANLSETEMTNFINADTALRGKDRTRIYESYQKYRDKLKKKGSLLSIFNPEEDMTIEDILYLLKPRGYKVIVIDYIGLLKGVGGDDSWQKLGAAARFAKVFAGANKCVVILCAQLSDEGQIKYSRAITEHSSVTFNWIYDETAKQTGIINVGMKKARNMKPLDFNLKMDFEHMIVRDVTEQEKLNYQEQSKSDSKALRKNKKTDGLDPSLYDAELDEI